jgi:hypothetical protein
MAVDLVMFLMECPRPPGAGRNAPGWRRRMCCAAASYELALGAYRRGDWPDARRRFSDCLGVAPKDGPTRAMLQRIETLAATPPTAAGWSRVWRLGKEDGV